MSDEIETLEIAITGRMQQLLKISAEAFSQPEAVVARPLGVDSETCRLAAELSRRLMMGEHLNLAPLQLLALLPALQLVRHELSAELHCHLQDLQKSMAAIVTAHTAREIEQLAVDLPKQAERAARQLRDVLKQRGALLDECEALIKKIRRHLELVNSHTSSR